MRSVVFVMAFMVAVALKGESFGDEATKRVLQELRKTFENVGGDPTVTLAKGPTQFSVQRVALYGDGTINYQELRAWPNMESLDWKPKQAASILEFPFLKSLRRFSTSNEAVITPIVPGPIELPELDELNLERMQRNRTNDPLAWLAAPRLRRLDASGLALRDEHIVSIANFPLLEHLDLSSNDFSDASLREITKLERLRYLSLVGNQRITGDGVRTISKLSELRELTLERLTPEMLVTLSALPNLERLTARQCLSNGGRIDFSCLIKLKCLTLYDPPKNVSDTIRLPAELRELVIDNVTAATMDLRSCPRLAEVHCVNIRARTPAELEWLQTLPSLKKLVLVINGPEFNAETLSLIPGLLELELQMACPATLTARDIAFLANFKNLGHLTLEAFAITDDGLAVIDQLPALRHLELLGCGFEIPIARMSQFWKLKHLRVVNIESFTGKVIDPIFEHIPEDSKIEDFQISGKLTDRSLLKLVALKNLRRLDLEWNDGFSDTALASLIDELPVLREVRLRYKCRDQGNINEPGAPRAAAGQAG